MPPPPGRYQRPMFQEPLKHKYQAPPASQAGPMPAAPPAPPNAMSLKLSQLRQLADLKAQGILSEAEFEAQKAVILGPEPQPPES